MSSIDNAGWAGEAAHALLAPSDLDTWIVCSAKPLMVAGLLRALPVQPDHKRAADDGTASHWAMAEIAAGRMVAEGQITDDGHVLSQEMIDGAQMLIDDVWALVPHIPVDQWHVEQRVSMRRLHRDNWGTPDFWCYDPATRTIYLWDYKFGHLVVDVFENWQLIDYLYGILDFLGIEDIHVKVVMTIVQPRAYHPHGTVRRWKINDASNLRSFWNRIQAAAELAMSGFAKAVPNANCGYCEARHVCQALQKDAYRSADLAEQSVPLLMDPVSLGVELSMLESAAKRLQARVEGLKILGEDMALQKQKVPGWHLVKTVPRKAFDETKVPELKAAVAMFGVSPVKDKPLTPNQVVDALVAAVPDMTEDDAFGLISQYLARLPEGRKFERMNESEGRRLFGNL